MAPEILLWLNTSACGVMLLYVAYISVIMPGSGMWGRRLAVWVLAVSLGCQITAPWTTWLPNPSWYGVVLHTTMAVLLIAWWREAAAFAKCKFALPPSVNPMRRADDFGGAV